MIGARVQEVILHRMLKTEPGGKLFPITRVALRRAIHRGCMRAFPHPVISQIEPSKRTPEQKAELKAWVKAHSWHPNQVRHTVATETRQVRLGGRTGPARSHEGRCHADLCRARPAAGCRHCS